MTELLVMVVLGVICWIFRITFVLLVPVDTLPPGLLRGLDYLAPAVLAGIAAVELTAVVTEGDSTGTIASLAAMALVAVVAYLTKNLTAVIGVGLAAILVIDLLIR
ncbi:MAG: AzlD domain-containing protein [Propionibacteriaceae bacterium]